MPTVLRVGPYQFFFYASDGEEPPHVHIRRDNKVAKFWLDPIEPQKDGGLRRPDIRRIIRIMEDNQRIINSSSWRHGMTSSISEETQSKVENVLVSSDELTIILSYGVFASAPLSFYPRLVHASQEERDNWQVIGQGEGIHWPDLDEDISVEGILAGRKSGESRKSFQRWLEAKNVGCGLTLYELRADADR